MPPGGLHRIVVAYDDSDGANAAAGFALLLAARARAEVTIAHACPPVETPGAHPDAFGDFGDQIAACEAEWARRLGAVTSYGAADVQAQTRLVHGHGAGALIDLAREIGADALLAGSHRAGHIGSALAGSTSMQLLQHAPCAVMLFPQGAAPGTHAHAVVVGVDGSPGSAHAVALGQELAVALSAELVLAHAVDPHIPFVGEPTKTLRTQMHRAAREVVHAARVTVSAPLDVVREEIVEAAPADGLRALCERHAPAIVVVGSRGTGGFRELLLGATPHRLAHSARFPMLVARPARTEPLA